MDIFLFLAVDCSYEKTLLQIFDRVLHVTPEEALHRCSYKKVFWKYTAKLQEITHAEMRFQWSCKATLLKLHFAMGVLL